MWVMSKIVRILKYSVLFLSVAVITGCAPSRKNPYLKKRNQTSRVNTSQLGRNRYYFSNGYQKKLSKNYRERSKKKF
jgi:hypothetical protein